MNRNLQLLGMAKKAGLLAIGGESVSAAAWSGKAAAIISASDASQGSIRRARENAKCCGVVHIVVPYTKFEFGNAAGRGSPGTLAILDAGLAAGFIGRLAESEPERYGEMAEVIAKSAGRIDVRKRIRKGRAAQ